MTNKTSNTIVVENHNTQVDPGDKEKIKPIDKTAAINKAIACACKHTCFFVKTTDFSIESLKIQNLKYWHSDSIKTLDDAHPCEDSLQSTNCF